MAPLRSVAGAPGPRPVEDRLLAALRWWLSFLFAGSPREVFRSVPVRPALLFGDGACEATYDGIGAVLFDDALPLCEAFGCEVPRDVAGVLRNATGNEQIIGQLEILPFVVALRVWRSVLRPAGRRVVIFVDNDAARYAMIKGYSPSPVSRALVSELWSLITDLQLTVWFERVPSAGNPADAAIRLDLAALRALTPQPRVVHATLSGQAVGQVLAKWG